MKIKHLTIILFGTLILLSCNNRKKPSDFDYGKFENGQYTNSFFNFEMTAPAGWQFLSRQQNETLMNKSSELVASENKALQEATDASKITTVILFTCIQYDINTVSDSVFNPNIMITAENLKGNDKIKTASEYLLLTRKTLDQQPIRHEYPELAFQTMNINGTSFSSMKVVANELKPYTQNYYVTLENNFALTFILTYATETQRITLEQALNTLKFNNVHGNSFSH